jgi:hypothetical protein
MSKKTRRGHKRRGLVKTAKNDLSRVGKESKDIAQTGISGIYNLISSGFNTGVKGVKSLGKDVGNAVSSKPRRHRRHRSRKSRKH